MRGPGREKTGKKLGKKRTHAKKGPRSRLQVLHVRVQFHPSLLWETFIKICQQLRQTRVQIGPDVVQCHFFLKPSHASKFQLLLLPHSGERQSNDSKINFRILFPLCAIRQEEVGGVGRCVFDRSTTRTESPWVGNETLTDRLLAPGASFSTVINVEFPLNHEKLTLLRKNLPLSDAHCLIFVPPSHDYSYIFETLYVDKQTFHCVTRILVP